MSQKFVKLVEDTLSVEDESLNELFGSDERAVKTLMVQNAVKDIVKSGSVNKIALDLIMSDEGIDYIKGQLKTLEGRDKQDAAYFLFLVYALKRKKSFFGSSLAKKMLKHKDEDIRTGAESAVAHIESKAGEEGLFN